MIITITKKQLWTSFVIILVLMGIWTLTRPASAPSPQQPPTQRTEPTQTPMTNDGIDVRAQRLPSTSATESVFTIALNTHSGDLSIFDALANVQYRGTDGTLTPPTAIGGDRETHHRTIEVTFDRVSFPGDLIISNLGTVKTRTFHFLQ